MPLLTRPEPRSEESVTVGPLPRTLPWLLLVGGLVGTVAALVLTIEKISLLADSTYVPSCSLNPILNCGSVMRTEQAELFGFPNPLLGLVGFPVVVTTGALLLGGGRPARWYWLGLQAGVLSAGGFVAWLIFQSLYRIGALCPYCMVVWAVVIPMVWYVTLTNAASGRLGTSCQHHRWVAAGVANHAVVLTSAYCLVLTLIMIRFWDYWSGLL